MEGRSRRRGADPLIKVMWFLKRTERPSLSEGMAWWQEQLHSIAGHQAPYPKHLGNAVASTTSQACWAGGTTLGLAAMLGWCAGVAAGRRE